MDLEAENITPISTNMAYPPIFISTVNYFHTFCNTIKEVTVGEQFSCKSTI